MSEELSRTRLYVNTPLNNNNKSGLPLINLDWGSTNLPLKQVEERVTERVWSVHGNPGSCGSYTGGISKNVIEGVSRTILKHLNVRGEVFYGGAGATHWLGKIANHHKGSRLMLVQTEVHDALVRGWEHIDRHDPTTSDQQTWVRRMSRKYGPENLVLGVALSSHLTGGMFEDRFAILDYCKDLGIKVILDATCYLAHHKKPEIPHFDYLVFSPHKLPGGTGSCGVMVVREHGDVSWCTEPGSQNVPGIVRIEEAISVMRGLKEPEDVDGRMERFSNEFGKLREGCYSIEMMKWDDHRRSEPHFSFRILWTSPDKHVLQVHPNLVAMICTQIYGLQIRGGGMCAESFITNGLCRISVPRYLFTEELSGMILEKFRDMIRYMNYYVRCYELDSQGGWRVRSVITNQKPEVGTTQVKSCCMGPQSSYLLSIGKEEPLRGGMMVIDWLFPDVWSNVIRTKSTDDQLDDPDRWFLHPDDLKASDPEI